MDEEPKQFLELDPSSYLSLQQLSSGLARIYCLLFHCIDRDILQTDELRVDSRLKDYCRDILKTRKRAGLLERSSILWRETHCRSINLTSRRVFP